MNSVLIPGGTMACLTILTATLLLSSALAGCPVDECSGLFCPNGRAFDSNGCIECDCLLPCEDVTCAADETCVPVRVPNCNGLNCAKFVGTCVSDVSTTTTTTRAPCPALDCTQTVPCRFGQRFDANGCPTCQCFDPCENLNCLPGEICQLTADDCAPGEDCRDSPMPHCVVSSTSTSSTTTSTSSTTTTSTPTTTTTTSTSTTSTTSTPSTTVSTSSTTTTPTTTTTVTTPVPTTSSTTTTTTTTTTPVRSSSAAVNYRQCPPDPCLGLACLYGRAFNSQGCVLCDCFDPCLDVSCASGEQCKVVTVDSCSGVNCHFRGVCTATTTVRQCPVLNCTLTGCRFGLKFDDNMCDVCQCYDPCESYTCPSGEECQLTADDCPPDAERCRDSPMPHCVAVPTSTISTTLSTNSISSHAPIPSVSTTLRPASDSQFQECCLALNVESTCLQYCSYEVPTAEDVLFLPPSPECLDIVQCARDGSSHTACCASRGVPSGCLGMCHSPIDMSSITSECLWHFHDMLACIDVRASSSPPVIHTSLNATSLASSSSSSSSSSLSSSSSTSSSSSSSSSSSTTTTTTTTSTTTTTTTTPSTPAPTTTTPPTSTSSTSLSSTLSQLQESTEQGSTQIDGILRINANYSIIDDEDTFKQRIQVQISKHTNLDSRRVRITKLMRGSIIVYFSITQPQGESAQLNAALQQWMSDNVAVEYNGRAYDSVLVSYALDPSTPASATPSPTVTEPDSHEKYHFLLLVVLICVLVPVVLAIIIVVIICIYKSRTGSSENGWKTMSEAKINSGKQKGFQNPQYVTVEIKNRNSLHETFA